MTDNEQSVESNEREIQNNNEFEDLEEAVSEFEENRDSLLDAERRAIETSQESSDSLNRIQTFFQTEYIEQPELEEDEGWNKAPEQVLVSEEDGEEDLRGYVQDSAETISNLQDDIEDYENRIETLRDLKTEALDDLKESSAPLGDEENTEYEGPEQLVNGEFGKKSDTHSSIKEACEDLIPALQEEKRGREDEREEIIDDVEDEVGSYAETVRDFAAEVSHPLVEELRKLEELAQKRNTIFRADLDEDQFQYFGESVEDHSQAVEWSKDALYEQAKRVSALAAQGFNARNDLQTVIGETHEDIDIEEAENAVEEIDSAYSNIGNPTTKDVCYDSIEERVYAALEEGMTQEEYENTTVAEEFPIEEFHFDVEEA